MPAPSGHSGAPWPARAQETAGARTVDDHRSVIRTLLPRPEPRLVSIADALGRVLATDVVAAVPIPAFACSSMDGYAVDSRDVRAAGPGRPVTLRVTDDIPAGRNDVPALTPGCAHRIMTGAPLPLGADAVVEVEQTSVCGDRVEVSAVAAPGRHVRQLGEDVPVGLTALDAGTVLGPLQLALLSALGLAQVSVWPALRVLVVSAGSELIAPGTPPRAGSTYESNAAMLAAAVRAAGAEAQLLTGIPDDPALLRAAVRAQLSQVDVVLTTGGVSAGAYEVVKEAFADSGVTFVDVAMRPGRPQGAGELDGVPVIAFPGTPVAALTSFEVLLRPALRAAMRLPDVERQRVAVRLTDPVTSRQGTRQYVLGHLDEAQGCVAPVTGHTGHHLRSLATANCLIEVGDDITVVAAGTIVEAWRLS